jgi:hypothetical protein
MKVQYAPSQKEAIQKAQIVADAAFDRRTGNRENDRH